METMQYNYTKLKDIKIGDSIHVIGVVKFFQCPIKTKGSSYKMTVSITDPTIGYDNKLTCNIFHDKPEDLPRIKCRGDIIVMHRLRIIEYNHKPQGSGSQKYGFTSAVFSQDNKFDVDLNSIGEILKLMNTNQKNFNITKEDLRQVQELLYWSDNMPSSQDERLGDNPATEINLDQYFFLPLSQVALRTKFSLVAQLVGVILLSPPAVATATDEASSSIQPAASTLLLVRDGSGPMQLDISVSGIAQHLQVAISMRLEPRLMAELGGKLLAEHHLAHVLLPPAIASSYSGLQPGESVYLTTLSAEPAPHMSGVHLLAAPNCRIGVVPSSHPLSDQLAARLRTLPRRRCVADCTAAQLTSLQSFPLQEYGRILAELANKSDETISEPRYQFKIVANVVKVHPSTFKEFFNSIVLFCVTCKKIHEADLVHGGPIHSAKNDGGECEVIPVPLVTMVFEDFTGWLAAVAVGESVLRMLALAMVEAAEPAWWRAAVTSGAGSSSEDQAGRLVSEFLHRIARLVTGWIQARLVLRRQNPGGPVLAMLEDMVILDEA